MDIKAIAEHGGLEVVIYHYEFFWLAALIRAGACNSKMNDSESGVAATDNLVSFLVTAGTLASVCAEAGILKQADLIKHANNFFASEPNASEKGFCKITSGSQE